MEYIVNLVEKLKNGLMIVFKYIVGTTFSIMIIIAFLQVIFRYVFHNSLTWSEELSRYMFVWAAFLGAALAYSSGSHVEMDLVTSILKPKMKKVFKAISYVIIAVLLFNICKYGFQIVNETISQPSPALRVPMAFVYLAIPIGSIGMMVVLIDNILKSITGKKEVA